MFGEFIKKKRLGSGLSLREFCRKSGYDASNWSKVERGVLAPPQEMEKLSEIARLLAIEENSEEWNYLVDTARVATGHIPEYILSNEEVMRMLPAFFRTVGNVKPTSEELNSLIEKIRNGV
ncbi:MAG: helix-turn-helix domain-containing protein [Armatimonadetes bacterium]|nr:helix-turn-helix domain-containing protein [Armatimonadota bacterium]